jgi:hypothetical protein
MTVWSRTRTQSTIFVTKSAIPASDPPPSRVRVVTGSFLRGPPAVLGHVSGSRGGIVGVYQRHTYADEKRAALDAWARRLAEIISGETPRTNVVELRAS